MEKMRIVRNDIYEIEVNDNGDTLKFEMGDLNLNSKLNQAYAEINSIQNELNQKVLIINKKKDFKPKNSLLTNNQLEIDKAQKEAFKKMRKAIDLFIGEGGCQKVFGDSNYLEMWNDLYDALSKKDENGLSHLEKMGLSAEAVEKRIKNKYDNMKEQEQAI